MPKQMSRGQRNKKRENVIHKGSRKQAYKSRSSSPDFIDDLDSSLSSSSSEDFNKKPVETKATTETMSNNMNHVTQGNFSLLTRLVQFLRNRHLDGNNSPMTLDELLDASGQFHVDIFTREWLLQESLCNNKMVEVCDGNKYKYKPPIPAINTKSFLRILKRYDLRSRGGIDYNELKISLPNCDRILQKYASEITIITRPNDKKKIIFYNDKLDFKIDEDFKAMWHSFSVGHNDEAISSYLKKRGISAMTSPCVVNQYSKKSKKDQDKKKASKMKLKDNNHVADVLHEY